MNIDGHIDINTYTPQTGMVSAFWLWLKLCVSWVWPVEYIYEIEYKYEEDYQSVHRYTVNRHRRRFADKILPAERYSTFYHAIFPKHLSRAQFVERAARLSVKGRRKYYGTLRHSPNLSTKRMQFRVLEISAYAALISSNAREAAGLWSAHLWPD